MGGDQGQGAQLAVPGRPPDGGLWTSQKVATWIEQATGRRVRAQRGWEYLRRLGYTPQVPRPTHAKANPAEQEQFRKNSSSGWDR